VKQYRYFIAKQLFSFELPSFLKMTVISAIKTVVKSCEL
jgi:hypothetical protein